MERIYLLWWALLLGSGLTGLMLALFDIKRNGGLTRKSVAALISVALAVGAVVACPAMLLFDYDGLTCSESRYGISWLLLAAAASTLILAFRARRARRAQDYLRKKQNTGSDTL